MPQRNTIEIVINATDNASRVFNSLSDNTQTIGKLAAGAIVGGFTAATAAAVGFATKGLQEFTKFQAGMQEVFSLLPGISQDAMDEMNDQVKRISMTFGTLPEEVIPAVYEALSAGIPQDNVFSFVEVANKAAIAGVTDLATAVNGISSAMNAYGYDILDAATASDVMFQTVKLGKTTFEELSNSLYNVSPTAAALGVTFEDLNAQIAAITAQGVPTSVATNQMRQMFVELSKAGGKTADTFQQLAGKTFKQFIAEGGNTQDALQLLEKYAKETGVGINDLFSSVEAGSAALSLTGRNTERFTDFLDQMATSAGSTDAAFKTMSESLQYQMNRTQAKLSVLFINIGEKLAPAFAPLVEEIGNVIGWFADLVAGGTSLEDFIAYDLPDAFKPIATIILNLSKEFKRISGIISRFFAGVNAGVPFLDNLKGALHSIFPKDIADVISFIVDGLNSLWKIIKPIANSILKWVRDNVKLEDVLIAIGIAISSFVIPAIIAIGTAIAPIVATFTVLIGAVMLVRKAFESNFLGIRDIVNNVIGFIGTFITAIEDIVTAIQLGSSPIDAIKGVLHNFVDLETVDRIYEFMKGVQEAFTTGFNNVVNFIQNVALPGIKLFFDWLGGVWESVKPELEKLANWFVTTALPSIVSFVQNTVIPGIGTFVNFLLGIWNTVSPELDKLFNWFMNTGLPAIKDFILNEVIPRITELATTISGIWETVRPELEKFANWFLTDALPKIRDFIMNTVLPALGELLKVLVNLWNTVAPELDKILQWFVSGEGLKDITQAVNDFAALFAENSSLIKGLGALVALLVTSGGSGGVSGLLTSFANALKLVWTSALPVVGAIGALALAVYGLNDAVNEFSNKVATSIKGSVEELAPYTQSGQITQQDVREQAFKNAQEAHGDFLGRILYALGGGDVTADAIYQGSLKFGKGVTDGINDGITQNTSSVETNVGMLSDTIKTKFEGDLGISSPSTVFIEYGSNMLMGLVQGLSDQIPTVTEFMTQLKDLIVSSMDNLKESVTTSIGGITKSFVDSFKMILSVFTTSVPAIVAQINILIQSINQLKTSVSSGLAAISSIKQGVANTQIGNTPNTGFQYGYANGLPYAPRKMPIVIHPGEGVLTKQENADYRANQNGKPQVVIENVNIGSVENQNDADKKAEMFVNGLRLQGIEI